MTFHQFHDGLFEGFWVSKGVAQIYLSTVDGQRSTVVLEGVVMLKAGGFKEANIILDVSTRHEIQADDLKDVYELPNGHQMKDWESTLLKKAKEENMIIFEINSSYGGQLIALAHTCQVLANGVPFVTSAAPR